MIYINISYYAVIEYDDGGFDISFPDLPGCLSCAFSYSQALEFAKEALDLYLDDTEIDKLCKPSKLSSFSLTQNQKAELITIEMKVKNGRLCGHNVYKYE